MAINNESDSTGYPPYIVWILCGAFGFGGTGAGIWSAPQIERSALEACYNNAQIAIEVAAQHGDEFNEVRSEIASNRRLIYDRTNSRWTADAQREYDAQQRQIDSLQNNRLDHLENMIQSSNANRWLRSRIPDETD